MAMINAMMLIKESLMCLISEQLSEKQVAMINAMMLTKLSLLEEDIRVFSHSLQKLGERVQEQGSVMISQGKKISTRRSIHARFTMFIYLCMYVCMCRYVYVCMCMY